jgi:hypothetical protein
LNNPNLSSMKRLVLAVITFLSFSFVTYANDVEISTTVLQSFNKSFKNASEVKWTSIDQYYKADFIFNGQNVCAFYSNDGNLMAVTRHLLSTSLPVALQANLKTGYEEYWISDLFEISNEQGTSYFITLEKSDVKLILQSASGTEWSVYKRSTK